MKQKNYFFSNGKSTSPFGKHPSISGSSKHYWFEYQNLSEIRGKIDKAEIVEEGCTDHIGNKTNEYDLNDKREEYHRKIAIVLPMDKLDVKAYKFYLEHFMPSVPVFGKKTTIKRTFSGFHEENLRIYKNIGRYHTQSKYSGTMAYLNESDDSSSVSIYVKSCINSILILIDNKDKANCVPWMILTLHRNILRRPDIFNKGMKKIMAIEREDNIHAAPRKYMSYRDRIESEKKNFDYFNNNHTIACSLFFNSKYVLFHTMDLMLSILFKAMGINSGYNVIDYTSFIIRFNDLKNKCHISTHRDNYFYNNSLFLPTSAKASEWEKKCQEVIESSGVKKFKSLITDTFSKIGEFHKEVEHQNDKLRRFMQTKLLNI